MTLDRNYSTAKLRRLALAVGLFGLGFLAWLSRVMDSDHLNWVAAALAIFVPVALFKVFSDNDLYCLEIASGIVASAILVVGWHLTQSSMLIAYVALCFAILGTSVWRRLKLTSQGGQ